MLPLVSRTPATQCAVGQALVSCAEAGPGPPGEGQGTECWPWGLWLEVLDTRVSGLQGALLGPLQEQDHRLAG